MQPGDLPAVDGLVLLRPPATVPVHYDDYGIFRSPLQDFLREAERRGLPSVIQAVTRGGTVALTARARP